MHDELEQELAAWKGTDRAVLFPTGFAANLGTLTALGDAGVRIVSDSRNHASIIDGARLSRADVTIWRHGEIAELEALVAGSDAPTLVVADTVFSMDGDVLDVAAVADICRRHRAVLVLDEAHAVLGPDPTAADLAGVEVVRVGTLSKTLGSLGGFVACSDRVADLLINVARPGIFTTALSPADAGRRPGRPARAAERRRATPCGPRCAATSTASAPATRRPSCRSCSATSSGPSPPRPPCSSRASGSPPSGRPRWPPGPAASGSR